MGTSVCICITIWVYLACIMYPGTYYYLCTHACSSACHPAHQSIDLSVFLSSCRLLSRLSACLCACLYVVQLVCLPDLSVVVLPTCVCLLSCLSSLCLVDMSILASSGWRVEPIPEKSLVSSSMGVANSKDTKKLRFLLVFFYTNLFPLLTILSGVYPV